MSRLKLISPDSATGKAQELLAAVNAKLGLVPNMTRAMAGGPAALEGYLQLSGSLSHGRLSPKIREQLALAISEVNGCEYCLAAHSAVGKMVGLTSDQIRDSRLGSAIDPKVDALLRFARRVVDARGRVTNDDLAEVRAAGFDDGAIAEVVAHVALNVFTNYFNNVAETDLDFPKAAPLSVEPAHTA